uniref:Uncharacterized protein n=1 Tax=Nelumbo nucifera TaxID=4432 RepID=A0A822XSI6_NELNU|nr:TPA_asm: hypothetical protein HUJ06_023594 [Nelumbo nucifera]
MTTTMIDCCKRPIFWHSTVAARSESSLSSRWQRELRVVRHFVLTEMLPQAVRPHRNVAPMAPSPSVTNICLNLKNPAKLLCEFRRRVLCLLPLRA